MPEIILNNLFVLQHYEVGTKIIHTYRWENRHNKLNYWTSDTANKW